VMTEPSEEVHVEIARQQHRLKEEHTRRPYRCGAAKRGQHHLADHRLTAEQKECTEEQGDREVAGQSHRRRPFIRGSRDRAKLPINLFDLLSRLSDISGVVDNEVGDLDLFFQWHL